MNDDNQNQTIVEPQVADAEVIGELRKDSIGKPKLVIAILIILLVVLAVLPVINKMLDDENSMLYIFIHETILGEAPIHDDVSNYEETILNGGDIQLLNEKTLMRYENLMIKNMHIESNTIIVTLYSYNGVLDLDQENYYLEVYNRDKEKIGYIKLTGSIDYQETKYQLFNPSLNYNNMMSYYVKVVTMTDADYPEKVLPMDEFGKGEIVCTKDERTIKYTFMNNELIQINDNVSIELGKYPNDKYVELLQQYQIKATETNGITAENDIGFTYNLGIYYNTESIPKDTDYYEKGTNAKIIDYAQKGKGFDCK